MGSKDAQKAEFRRVTAPRIRGEHRGSDFILIAIIYIIGSVLGWAVFRWLSGKGAGFMPAMAAADSAATVWVFLWSTALANSSVYDPYWSAAPLLMLAAAAVEGARSSAGLSLSSIVILAAVSLWSIRLTANWALNFGGLSKEDWRYIKYHARSPRLWPLVNFFGIHLFPTVIVFLCCIPAFCALLWIPQPPAFPAAGRQPAGGDAGLILMILGAVLSLCGTGLELAADTQMRRFRASAEGANGVNDRGLWKYSRHPNYLGEILMWWGVYFFGAGACAGSGFCALLDARPLTAPAAGAGFFHGGGFPVWAFSGAILNTMLFMFISIPLLETRQLARRPGYADYMKRTGALLPLPDLSRIGSGRKPRS